MLLGILLVLQIIVAIALVGVILLQRSEGGALGMGGGPGGFMTARGAGDLLTRTTAILAAVFFGGRPDQGRFAEPRGAEARRSRGSRADDRDGSAAAGRSVPGRAFGVRGAPAPGQHRPGRASGRSGHRDPRFRSRPAGLVDPRRADRADRSPTRPEALGFNQ
jgi:protein translocase SecG subunit